MTVGNYLLNRVVEEAQSIVEFTADKAIDDGAIKRAWRRSKRPCCSIVTSHRPCEISLFVGISFFALPFILGIAPIHNRHLSLSRPSPLVFYLLFFITFLRKFLGSSDISCFC